MLPNRKPKKFAAITPGFTIVELLVVMGILAILAVITLVAINPAYHFAKSRDTKRRAGVEAVSNAIHQYIAEQRGVIPGGITSSAQFISSDGVDLCDMLTPEYIAALPQDPENNEGARILPSQCGDYDTGFTIRMLDEEHFIVEAPYAETEEDISQTR